MHDNLFHAHFCNDLIPPKTYFTKVEPQLDRGAFRFGSLTSVFFAIQHICAVGRQQIDVANTALAAGATGSIFGFFAGISEF